eukprot:TRINITY_DN3631_c0_g2_i1.p1 TRINITY_DN3631_c0_g2~~TRINITY_DN3631_c0_g2_i1.p1  ORF type:complete len:376 (+),score=69.18 TRINITY_DN3631_c0_g2_i1:71-1129(+)
MHRWFRDIFGHDELPYDESRKLFVEKYDGETLLGMKVGDWVCLPLSELRHRVKEMIPPAERAAGESSTIDFDHIVGEAGALHKENPGALFQVASQYNFLEFPSKSTTPERGITNYINDRTQGPACALACPAATAFRNYILLTNGKRGQQSDNQQNALDLLDDRIKELTGKSRFTVRNGYLDSTEEDLRLLNEFLAEASPELRRELKDTVKVGFHLNAEVLSLERYVGQAFCAAPAIGYSSVSSTEVWEPLSRLILEACYEACLWGALLQKKANAHPSRGKQQVFLTCIGGGVFANDPSWIADSITFAMQALHESNAPLSIHLVHFRKRDQADYLSIRQPTDIEDGESAPRLC